MSETRIHRAISADGTEIAGRVVGQGPPLVLVHGMIGDGEYAWTRLLPHLTDRFTCYLPSTRGRGLSGEHPDHTLARQIEDITAFVASIDAPTGLMGWSGGGPLVLGVAEQLDTVTAAAVWESGVSPLVAPPETMEALGGHLGAAVEQVGIAAGEGRLADAVRAFIAGICNDEEIAAAEETDFSERWSVGIPDMLVGFQNMAAEEDPGPFAPAALAQVSAPTAFFVGAETLLHQGWSAAARHLAGHVGNAQVRDVPGVGHFAPVVAPEVVAAEMGDFFGTASPNTQL